jgi:hypothetical protein
VKCPDCGSVLVDELPGGEAPVAIIGDNDLLFMEELGDVSEIQIIRSFLEDNGIFYFMREDTPNKAAMGKGPIPYNGMAVRARLYIEKARFEEAAKLIKEIREAQVDLSDMNWSKQPDEDKEIYETAELCEVDNDFEAEAVKNILSQEGIYSFIRNNVMPMTGITLFFFKHRGKGTIIVNKEDFDRAKKIVNDMKRR